MIEYVEIKTVEEAARLILDREYNAEIDRMRSSFLFRGMGDTSYRLTTSLERNCGSKQIELEPSILKNFTKYAVTEDPHLNDSVWRQMIAGQHHGLPTRLLDWTHSSLIAMHFATCESDMGDTDRRNGVVWRIDPKEMAAMLPGRYREILAREKTSIFSVETLKEAAPTIAAYDTDMAGAAMAIIEPPSTDQRIINQYSYFSVVPYGMGDIEAFLDRNTSNTVKYVIDKSIRWDIRDLLDQFNISERVIYPGLDGLSRWISRHYYVKRPAGEREEQ